MKSNAPDNFSFALIFYAVLCVSVALWQIVYFYSYSKVAAL
jgi:hypothetical protein